MGSDGLAVAVWYLVAMILGWSSVPIAWRIFGRFDDRGYAFARPLGLLAVGYSLWLGGTLGVVDNTSGGILGIWLLWSIAAVLSLRGRWDEFATWLRDHLRTITLVEILFLVTFAGWAYVRSFDPGIRGTEKPMELAFLNAVLEARGFPPPDPWLSGYAISYYYFGFVLMGAITKVTSVPPGVAFNLTISLWFALTIVASYGVVNNLIAAHRGRSSPLAGLLGPLFVAISGNLEGFLDLLHTRGVFWTESAEGMTSSFWRWLDIKDLVNPPLQVGAWLPDRNWWWWRASRVVRDVNLAGGDVEVIDEFPFFSFLLADNHPHVLALPFVLLALAFALHIFLGGQRNPVRLSGFSRSRLYRPALIVGGSLLAGLLLFAQISGAAAGTGGALSLSDWAAEVIAPVVLSLAGIGFLFALISGALRSALPLGTFVLAGWLFGSLAFLNAWDFPIYLALFGAVLIWSLRSHGWEQAVRGAAITGFGVLLMSILLYLPWYPSFSSQAGGVLPNLAYPTKVQHFVVMFAPLLIPILVWSGVRLSRTRKELNSKLLIGVGLGLPLGLFALSWGLAGLVAVVLEPGQISSIVSGMGAPNLEIGVREALRRRVVQPWTPLVLGLTVAAVVHLLAIGRGEAISDGRKQPMKPGGNAIWPFVAMLIGVGSLLVMVPEFIYIRDSFGTRMNTVFKFYYAAWVLLGIAAAYATYELWPRENGMPRLRALVVLPLILGLFYPAMGIASRTGGFSSDRQRTLDGTEHLQFGRPEDLQAIRWINENLDGGVVAEAVGGSYTEFARISTHTDLQTVLGWVGHELQWRGGVESQGSRGTDIERLYSTSDWQEAQEVVRQYGIDYVYIGPLERSTYGPIRENKFEVFMTRIYEQGQVVIYAARDRISQR